MKAEHGMAEDEDVARYMSTFIFNVFVFAQVRFSAPATVNRPNLCLGHVIIVCCRSISRYHLQLFNQINARSLTDSKNVFARMRSSRMWVFHVLPLRRRHVHFIHALNAPTAILCRFITIVLGEAALQVFMVQFGGPFTKTTGLTSAHWLVSIGIAAITLPLGVIMRFIPVPSKPSDYAYHFQSDFAARMARRRLENDTIATVVAARRSSIDTAHMPPQGYPADCSTSVLESTSSSETASFTPRLVLDAGTGVGLGTANASNPFSPSNALSQAAFLQSGYTPPAFGTHKSSGNANFGGRE
jgi:hypothetical protein